MTETVKIISPVDGRVYAERPVASGAEIDAAVSRAKAARTAWGEVTVRERAKFLTPFRRCDPPQERRDRAGACLADGPADPLQE